MRILIVNTSEHTGGAAVAANRLMVALHKNGVKAKMLVRDKTTDNINVASLGNGLLQKFFFVFERACIWICNGFSKKNLFAVDIANVGNDITKTEEFREADVIHLHWINQGMLSLSSIENILKSGKPVVWTMHDLWPVSGICHYSRDCEKFHNECKNCNQIKSNIAQIIQKRKVKAYSFGNIQFVSCSKWLRIEAEKSKIIKNHKITNIPNAIDTTIFHPVEKRKIREKLNLPIDKKLILFSSAKVTDERKGFKYFIETCSYLKSNQNIAIVIMGSKSDTYIHELPFEVYSLGYLNSEKEAAEAYNVVDLFVTPSLEDNLPNTIMEALACGTPCVGFNVGGIPEMIDHKQNGYVAEYKNAEDMAEGIKWCLDEANYRSLTEASLKKVRTCYSQDAVAQQYIKIYQQLSKKYV